MRILSVTSVRNEGTYLLEWIAHHQAAGVTDFLIFSNDCDDGTDQMLNRLDQAGIVTHIAHEKDGKKSIQWQALKAAWKHPLRKEVDWILVSDVDEFVNIHVTGHTFADLLGAVPEGTDGIAMPWRLYGHNDVSGIEDAPVTEQFTRAISTNTYHPFAAWMFKTLFRAKGPFNQLGVHRPKQRPEERAGLPNYVNGSGAPLPDWFARNQGRISLFGCTNGRALVEVNHYAVRSAAAFLLKRDRGLPNRAHKDVDLSYWVERNYNTVEDLSISAMRPATKAALATLMQIEGIEDLHASAVGWHRNRFTELIAEPDYVRLMTRIVTAGGSIVLPQPLQLQLMRWFQDAHKTE